MIAQKRFVEAEKLIEAKMLGTNTESYQPMGDLYIEQHFEQNNSRPNHYIRKLDIDAGIAAARFQSGEYELLPRDIRKRSRSSALHEICSGWRRTAGAHGFAASFGAI